VATGITHPKYAAVGDRRGTLDPVGFGARHLRHRPEVMTKLGSDVVASGKRPADQVT
jgi:hypothetical protein